MSPDPTAESAAQSPPDAVDALLCLASVASDTWRIARLTRRTAEKLDPDEGARVIRQLRFLERSIEGQLEQSSVRIVNLEGQPFDPGLAATALNADQFSATDELIVEQMIEPIVMGPKGLLREGVIMLGRAGS